MSERAEETPHRRQRNAETDDTRKLLLDTAQAIVLDRGLPETIDIRISEVVAAAGRSTGSAYQIWATQDDFRHDLVSHMAENLDWDEPRRVANGLSLAAAGTTTFEDMVGALGRAYFEDFMGQPRFYVSMRFWAVVEPSEQLQAAIKLAYDQVRAGFSELLSMAFALYGRRVIEPFTIDDVCNAVMATADGHALRKKYDADALRRTDDNSHAFAAALLAITSYFTEIDPDSAPR